MNFQTKFTSFLASLGIIALSGTHAHAGVLINLDATGLPLGPLPTWTNTGSTAGDFTAAGAPSVTNVSGTKAVTFNGSGDFYAGPIAPASVSGVNPSRSIEVWAFNSTIDPEETLVGWGHRGGPAEGTNLAFNYGNNASFGAVGQWGAPDLGWNNAGGAPAAGRWHYLVYTYDGGGLAGAGTTRVYSDGVLQNSEFYGNINTHTGFPFVIGGQNNDVGAPAGFAATLSIARVRVHDVALTDSQIAAQFTAEYPQIVTQASVTSAGVQGENFVIQVTDLAPQSVVNPSTFSIAIQGVTGGGAEWSVEGGEGVVNSSLVSPTLTVPNAGPVTLSFQHRFNFELDQTQANAYDGGVVQVSINGGPFTQLDNANFTQNGYTHEGGIPANPLLTIIGTGVLNGLNAFNGPSGGFITSIATIPSLAANDTVRIRFLGAWDEGYTPDGLDWEFRSVAVTSGAATLINANFASGSSGGFTTEATAPSVNWVYNDGSGAETKSYNFDDAFVPVGGMISGTAGPTADGGVGNTSAMQLTDGSNGQTGSFFINDPAVGFTLKSMSVAFKAKLTGTSPTPGEGFSFVWANINDTAFGEEGTGNGLIVSFDTHDNGGAEAPAIDVKWNGAVLQHTPVSAATLLQPGFVPVLVTVHGDASVSVSFNGVTVANHIALPGFTGMARGRFAWGARSTTFTSEVLIDDISISLPRSGSMTTSKAGAVTTFTVPVRWLAARSYTFTLTGKDTDNDDLVISGTLASPYLPLTPAGFSTGYSEGSVGQWAVREYRQGPFPAYSGAVAIATNALLLNYVDGPSPVMSFSDLNGHPPCVYNLPFLTNDGSGNNDNIVVVGKTKISVTAAGDYTFSMHTDDGFALKVTGGAGGRFTAASVGNIDPQDNQTVAFRDPTGDSNTRGVYHFDGAGVYDLLFISYEVQGGAGWEVAGAPGDWVNRAGNPIFIPVGNTADPTLPPLPTAQAWPSSVPGPRGQNGSWGVRTYMNDGIYNSEDLASVLNVLTFDTRTPATNPGQIFDTQEATLNFVDPNTNGTVPLFGNARPFPGNTAADDNHVVSIAHGSIQITAEDNYTFNVHSDDGFFLRIRSTDGSANPAFYAYGGAGAVDRAAPNIMYFPAGTGDSDTRAVVHLRPGTYNLEFVTWEGAGGFFYQVLAARGDFLNNADTNTWAPIGLVAPITGPVAYPSVNGQWTVESTPPNGPAMTNNFGANTAVSNAVLADPIGATSFWDIINFNDLGPGAGVVGRIPGDVEWPRGVPGVDDNNYAMRMHGTLVIPATGYYQIGYDGDDGSALTIQAGSQYFDSVLLENATGVGVEVHTTTAPPANSGALAPDANMLPNSSVQFNQPGAIVGDPRTGVTIPLAAEKLSVPFNPSLNPSGSFSVEAWFNPAVANGAGVLTCAIASGHLAGADPRNGWLIYQSDTGWNFRIYNLNGQAFVFSIIGGPAPVPGSWHHVVATWDSIVGQGKIYVNGVLGASSGTGLNFVPNSDSPLTVGERSDGAFDWQGGADEVAVYDSTLDPTAVLAHYINGTNAGRLQPYPDAVLANGPLGYWKLDEANTPVNLTTTTLKTDIATGSSRTVGRIHLTAGSYPISGIFWEAAGGSSFEIFATREVAPGATIPVQPLKNGGFPPVTFASGLTLVPPPSPSLPPSGGFVKNPNGSLSITFLSEEGSVYALESTTDLTNPSSWVEITNAIAGTGGYVTFTGVAPPAPSPYFYVDPLKPKQFYRIRRL